MTLSNKEEKNICVVGLGYVGLPLACLLSQKFKVTGFDISSKRIEELKKGIDTTREVENLKNFQVFFTDDEKEISKNNFIIVAVPTPIDDNFKPDLTVLGSACKTVGRNLTAGSLVSFESTVYPGCTEEFCVPILEKESGLKYGKDFCVGYSPERVNPGDKEHTIDRITKVVSGSDKNAQRLMEDIYGSITKVHVASSLKVAEAAKVIENVQRDLNIALMNELALIFSKLGIDTKDVIEAAGTKWNFHKYTPGLVGGHCIGVDPYYLTHKAQEVGHDPMVILAGREINNFMPNFVAEYVKSKLPKNLDYTPKALVYGLTFKENVPDTRNSKAHELISKLKLLGIEVYGMDPIIDGERVRREFGVPQAEWPPKEQFDIIVVSSPHKEIDSIPLEDMWEKTPDHAILFDVKGYLDKTKAEELGFIYHRL